MNSVSLKDVFAVLERYRSKEEYAALKQSCETAVTEWRWATGMMLPGQPHYELVCDQPLPKWSRKRPAYGALHGLDKDGRIRCIRSDDRTKPDEAVAERFLNYNENGFWCIGFGGPGRKPFAVQWFEMKGNKWLGSVEFRHNGLWEFLLDWEDDRVVRRTERIWEDVNSENATASAVENLNRETVRTIVYSYSYTPTGELDRVKEDDPPMSLVTYQRFPRCFSLKTLLREAENLLVTEIPKTIQSAKLQEKFYALLLQFTGVESDICGFAPPLLLLHEETRQRLRAEHPADADFYIGAAMGWQVGIRPLGLDCKNAALDEKLHSIFLYTTQAKRFNYGPVRKMFQRVCARLNALDWTGILNTTDDFIVIPFDTHGELDPNGDLKACVPREKLQLLTDRGYLWKLRFK